jgi:hypothetical protein
VILAYSWRSMVSSMGKEHGQNRRPTSKNDKTPYELWKVMLDNVKHFRVFGSKCYIKREDNLIGKFDSQVGKGILVGYSSERKTY